MLCSCNIQALPQHSCTPLHLHFRTTARSNRVQVPTNLFPDMEKQKQKANTGAQSDNDDVFADCSFSSLGLDPSLCQQLKERLGFDMPTRVQAQAIPVILSGRHALVNAHTGSGKTVAYLAPIIHQLHKSDPRIQRSDGTAAFCYCIFSAKGWDNPTHKVYEILQKLLHRFHWIVPGYVMGGDNRLKEKARLRKGISILVATPGRLLDHLKHTSSFSHTKLRWIVFDEADRILELGFGKEIEEILDILGSKEKYSVGSKTISSTGFKRQNILLSATLNEKVNHLAKISLENPMLMGLDDKKILADPPSEQSGAIGESEYSIKGAVSSAGDYKLPSQLVQRYVKVPCGSRLAVLLSISKHLFERGASTKVVVFFSTCDAVDFHYKLINEFQWSPYSQEAETKQMFLRCKTFRLHGNMKQEDRKTTFQSFKVENSALLLSTDVAARGLDIPKVRCIIQYDSPGEATEYVHRVGRTARLDEKGEALLFLQPVEIDYLQDLEKHGVSLSEYPISKVLDSFPLHGQKLSVKKFVSLDSHPWVLVLQKALESFVLSELSLDKLAKTAYCSWVRAYTAHRGELKKIFMVKKLHLGHVAKSFALKEQPSLVGKTFHNQQKKRKREQRQSGLSKKRKVSNKT